MKFSTTVLWFWYLTMITYIEQAVKPNSNCNTPSWVGRSRWCSYDEDPEGIAYRLQTTSESACDQTVDHPLVAMLALWLLGLLASFLQQPPVTCCHHLNHTQLPGLQMLSMSH